MPKVTEDIDARRAMQLIVLFGLVSLFGDVVYEGARSVNGPYLKTLSANAAMVGLIAGVGEFAGYGLRLLSGWVADRSRAYWAFIFAGYGMLVAVPLLALSGVWQVAAVLMVAERLGKGIRSPAKDAILSGAAKRVGTGRGFAIQEVLDQVGALLGPLVFAAYFTLTGGGVKAAADYRHAYALFWVPVALVMAFALVAHAKAPDPARLEPPARPGGAEGINRLFWLYNAFSFVTAFGFVSFALMGYHFKAQGVLADAMIPALYAVAMVADGAAAWLFGHWYDAVKARLDHHAGGLLTLACVPVLAALVPLLAFTRSAALAFAGAVLWGVVMGAHETIMKAGIADITPLRKRGTGYGIFNFGYGLAMLAGGWIAGLLYERSLPALCWGAVGVQVVALAVFAILYREIKAARA